MVFREINWNGGVNINGEQLSHLRFADDVVFFARNSREMHRMLEELNKRGKQVGLKINASKSKVMQTAGMPQANLKVDGVPIEQVRSFVYLGQEVNVRHDLLPELKRRRAAGWRKFYGIIDVLERLDGKDRSCLFNSTVIKAMTYGSELWTPIKAEENLLAVTERAMERRMLKVSLCDHIKNDTLRQMSGVKDIVVATRDNKLQWAGHVARL